MLSLVGDIKQPPFYVEGVSNDASLTMQIVECLRETNVSDTPTDYSDLYTGITLSRIQDR